MAQLRQDFGQFVKRDTEVIVIGPENREAFKTYWRENNLPFTGLPNPNHSVLRLFGQEIKLFKLGRMPAQVIVDKAGMARYVHYGNSMNDIPDSEEILTLLDKLNSEQEHRAEVHELSK